MCVFVYVREREKETIQMFIGHISNISRDLKPPKNDPRME